MTLSILEGWTQGTQFFQLVSIQGDADVERVDACYHRRDREPDRISTM